MRAPEVTILIADQCIPSSHHLVLRESSASAREGPSQPEKKIRKRSLASKRKTTPGLYLGPRSSCTSPSLASDIHAARTEKIAGGRSLDSDHHHLAFSHGSSGVLEASSRTHRLTGVPAGLFSGRLRREDGTVRRQLEEARPAAYESEGLSAMCHSVTLALPFLGCVWQEDVKLERRRSSLGKGG